MLMMCKVTMLDICVLIFIIKERHTIEPLIMTCLEFFVDIIYHVNKVHLHILLIMFIVNNLWIYQKVFKNELR